RVSRVEAHAGRVRVWLETPFAMSAEVTPAALAALPLRPGDEVWVSVKASQVRVHPAGVS
ncbi:MAG: TOBE domain-containing protein, partial [Janibacter sp.]|nr:TOBE domain-containing protein [Janibacter sp.]